MPFQLSTRSIFNNWKAKIIALLVAIGLWFLVKAEIDQMAVPAPPPPTDILPNGSFSESAPVVK